jgi:hypothetical protein
MASQYFQLRLLFLTARSIVSAIHSAEYVSSASFNASAINGVNGPIFSSYNLKILGRSNAIFEPVASGSQFPLATACATALPRGEFIRK